MVFVFRNWPLDCSYELRGVDVETILILDDDAANLHGISDLLQFEHYSVLEASNGLQAIETGRHCGWLSLLLTDIELPDLSGTEVALALNGLFPNLPILFISGNAMEDWRSQDRINFKRFAANLVDFLEKPFSASELKTKIRNLIGRGLQTRIDKKNQGNQAA
jgi:CheY-like chemotaxis protein